LENKSSELIQILTESMEQVAKASNPVDINTIIETLLMKFTDSDLAVLLLFDSEKQTLYSKNKDFKTLSMVDAKGLLGKAFLSKSASIYNHIASEKHYFQSIDNPRKLKLKSQMIFPIVKDDNLLGIACTSRSIAYRKPYTKQELKLLSSLNSFLIKIIHILTNGMDVKYREKIDTTTINEQIIQTEKSSDNDEKSSNAMFVSNIVHDIRTPANTLFGFLELIEEQIEDKRLKEFVSNAKESAEFINTLTDSILEGAKEAHEIGLSKLSTINSVKFFAHIANMFSSNMQDKSIDYLIYIDPLIPKEININEIKLKRVIVNLIGNAYKFTPRGKRIDFKVKFDAQNHKLRISVIDFGIGIDIEKQKEIFKAFTQAEEDTSKYFGGTGLGLAISAAYTGELGGKLKLKSELDKGSKFSFSIPIDIIDDSPSYEKFKNYDKKILILTDYPDSIDSNNIQKYLVELAMPLEKITISGTFDSSCTHLFCFQHKISPEVLDFVEKNQIKMLLVEEELFSLSKDSKLATLDIMSKNTYYGEQIHSLVFSGKKTKILLADDNKINIMLLKSMIETEYVEIHSALNGLEVLEALKNAHLYDDNPFDMIFLDKNMPKMSGSDLLRDFRVFEKLKNLKPIYAISITGEPVLSDEEKSLYDTLICKPFKKETVRNVIKSYIEPSVNN